MEQMYERIFLGLLCWYTVTTGTNAESLLWLDPPKVVVRYEDPVSVNCSTNITHLHLDWETPQGDVLNPGPKTVTWTVEKLTEWEIKPLCFMNVDKHNIEQIHLDVTIYKTPDRVSISAVGHSGPMIEGKQYELQCDVQSVAPVEFLTVKWYKGDTLVGNTTFNDSTKTPVNQSPILRISPRRDDNGTYYRCVAELDLGPDGPQQPPTEKSDPFNITVHYGPEISCPNQVSVEKGEVFTPTCLIKGYPPPEKTWYKDGEIVDFSQPMDKSDAGAYNLIANNSNKVAIYTMEVEVLYPPVSILELQNKSLDFGHSGPVLKCSSDAKPRPQYRWEYNQAPNVKTVDEDGVSLLSIDYATGQNTGTYTCTVSNKLGEMSQSVRVDVRDLEGSVSIHTVGHRGPMIADRKYNLSCDIHFVSPVRLINVSWYKGDRQVKSELFNFSTVKTQSDTLVVSPNRTENGTQYKCKAEVIPRQIRGEKVSDPLSIIVHYKPVINMNKLPSVVPVFRGYPEVLVCEAEGYPKPTITWTTRMNTRVENGNLTIIEATNENVGIYNCTASNSVETTVRVVKVIMKETPGVTISTVGHSGPMSVGGQYELQCDIEKVSPVEFLTVNWYKGDTLVENITFADYTKSARNVSAILQISPSRDDDGAQYWCEVELILNWKRGGTQPSLKVSSPVLGITVRYGERTTFWAIVGSFIGLAVVIILAYILKKKTGQY